MRRNSFVTTLALLALLATASVVQAGRPTSSPFTGTWLGQDTVDGSTEYLVVNGGSNLRVSYQDDFGQVCWDNFATDYWFSSDLRATASGNTMTGVFKSAKCGHLTLSFMKGQTMVWTFDPHGAGTADDTLFGAGVTWGRS